MSGTINRYCNAYDRSGGVIGTAGVKQAKAMSVDITAKNGAGLNVTNVAWRFVVEFGRQCGWNPTGTSKPDWYSDAEPWDGTYDPAMGQFVSDVDAASLSQAVTRGLNGAQIRDVLSKVIESLNAHAANVGYKNGPAASASDKTIDMLRQFAELAKSSGGFYIA